MNIEGARVTVFGMGKSGLATIGLLHAHGAVVRASDVKAPADLPDLGVEFVPQGPEALAGCDLAVLSPGVTPNRPLFEEAAARGVKVVGDVEAASWFLRGPIIGITGANGKTTTTALVGHLLETAGIPCQVGGNIGTPLASMVNDSSDGKWNVLELSSFQLETTDTLHVKIAAALNVTPDHLDRHGSFENYAAAKARIFRNQTGSDFAVLNAENEPTVAYAKLTAAQVRWFHAGGAVKPGFYREGDQLTADGVPFMAVSEVKLRGRHNLENVLAGACAAHLAGAPLASIREGVMTFPGVEHRIEYVRTVNGAAYFNDSKATNVDATVKALESFDHGLWVILGGKDKNSDYTTLRDLLHNRAKAALLIGAAAEKIAAHLGDAVRLERCGDLAHAVALAHREAQPGDTVLLAPACASFDQFSGYEERGRVFKHLVKELEN
ncbi:UDP-N-acetylmuramoyl-L-alanine--D-glutamate ligase [Paludibaculum fermentans]|uniref:UDP-N-acetylmuramoylalanine--D-glutamate ligase n=1 Tax=Paludibaculum fermentans TaxID=1473598 RepID=A0A7S7NXK2_PALFE|nr:UDP-N-acetylmuramoyl-L-alanine--D-glutamate ligase [Paludibaculum fermentans]QOY91624.1 UDP-N-acetylmuramoyl-L-alanine--D-glutamate ligase [Paludibaculum fermentans]